MTLDEFINKFSATEEVEPDDFKTQMEKKSNELKPHYNVAFKVSNGHIYVYTDGEVGIAVKNGAIKNIISCSWKFPPTYFSIDIGIISAVAEVELVDGEQKTIQFNYKIPKSTSIEPENLFDTNIHEIVYNDGQGSRDRQVALVIYSKNRSYVFTGKSIKGVCAVTKSDYHKNGKWSNSTYHITINKGYKVSRLKQTWGLGYYCDVDYEDTEPDFRDLHTLKKSFGMTELCDDEFVFLIKNKFKREYLRYVFVEKFE